MLAVRRLGRSSASSALRRCAALRRSYSTQPASASAAQSLPSIDPTTALSEQDVAQFSADGAIVLRGVLSPAWVEALRDAAEENLLRPGPLCDEHAAAQGTGGRFHDDQFLWHRHAACEEYVLRSGVGALAARAMSSSTAHILYDQLFVKEPGTAAPTPWHNDTSYWHIRGEQVCSVWAALDEVPTERGLSYVRGSHRWGLMHAVTNFSGDAHSERNVYGGADEQLPAVPDVDAKVASGEWELLAWDMEPGDVLLFYSAMLHGASRAAHAPWRISADAHQEEAGVAARLSAPPLRCLPRGPPVTPLGRLPRSPRPPASRLHV